MVLTRNFRLSTRGSTDIVDVTSQVAAIVRASGIQAGMVCVSVPGSTAAIITLEYEPGLIADLKAAFERLAPREAPYRHNDAWGDGNGYAHVRSSLMNPSVTLPVRDGTPVLGTWQQVAVVDFDNRPRTREVVVVVTGD